MLALSFPMIVPQLLQVIGRKQFEYSGVIKHIVDQEIGIAPKGIG